VIFSGKATIIAGGSSKGFADGVGTRASFSFSTPSDLLVLRDGSGILVTDNLNNRIRFIHTATQAVTTLVHSKSNGEILSAAIGTPRAMAFDLSSAEPESVVYITSIQGLCRLTLPAGSCSIPLFCSWLVAC
jgi:hypothetical protein